MIYDVLPVNNYTGNNSTTMFDFNFYIENENQLKVYIINSDDTTIELVYGKDYSINEFGNENGSYITFPLESSTYSVLADNQNISINLYLPILQQTQYENSSLLNLNSLEYSLDYLTRLIQILSRRIELCIKVTEGSNLTADELLLDIYNKAAQVAQNYNNSLISAEEIRNNIIISQNLITNLNNLISESTENIKDEAAKQINAIKSTGFYIENGILYYKNADGSFVEFIPPNCATVEQLNNKLDLAASNLDTQGKSYLSRLPLPSNKYTSLNLGASGSKYTAPANGWFACDFSLKQTSASGVMWGKMINQSAGYVGDLKFFTNTTEGEYMTALPVKNGDVISIQYQAPSVYVASWEYGLRFVYAEGVKE